MNKETLDSVTTEAVEGIISALSDRCGFDSWIDCLDEDIQDEIRIEMAEIIERCIKSGERQEKGE